MNYFQNCHTIEEIKERYRYHAKLLHPDKGGDPASFRELQEQYEKIEPVIAAQPTLPVMFYEDKNYTYHGIPVTYVGRDNYWYKFQKNKNGVSVSVDALHTWLIKPVLTAVW